jgi:hypothetical protein
MTAQEERLIRLLSDIGINMIVVGEVEQKFFCFYSITYPEKTQMSESLLLRFQGFNITDFIKGHLTHNVIESNLQELTNKITKLVEVSQMQNYVFSSHYPFFVIKK